MLLPRIPMNVSFSVGCRCALLAGMLFLLIWTGCQSSTSTVEEGTADSMPSYDTEAMARSIHEQINEERTANGREPLAWSDDLARLSRAHSQDMIDRDFFAHTNPDGESPTERGEQLDVSCEAILDVEGAASIAENIYDASAYHTRRVSRQGNEETVTYDWKTADEIVETVVQGWMSSSGHRRNTLNTSYQAQGLGLAVSEDLRVFVTQTFC